MQPRTVEQHCLFLQGILSESEIHILIKCKHQLYPSIGTVIKKEKKRNKNQYQPHLYIGAMSLREQLFPPPPPTPHFVMPCNRLVTGERFRMHEDFVFPMLWGASHRIVCICVEGWSCDARVYDAGDGDFLLSPCVSGVQCNCLLSLCSVGLLQALKRGLQDSSSSSSSSSKGFNCCRHRVMEYRFQLRCRIVFAVTSMKNT